MMNWQKFIPVIARTFLAVIFLRSGFNKITDFSGTLENITNVGVPLPTLMLIGAIVFEIVGALSVIFGIKARWGAVLLVIFMIPTTLIFHTNFAESMQVTQFFKNLSILGGLLLVVAFGAGPISFDAYRDSTKPSVFSSGRDNFTVRNR